MTVTLDAVVGDVTSNSNTGSQTLGTLTVGTGANRALIVAVTLQPAATSVAVHWDSTGTNQVMTLIGTVTDTASVCTVRLYGLVAPTSGNKTLSATWTGTSDVTLAAICFTGVNQTGSTTSFAHFNSAHAGTAPSLTVTSATGDYVVGALANSSGSFSTVGNTSWYLDNVPNFFSAAGNYATGAGTVTLTATPAVTYAYAGVDVVAAATIQTAANTETGSASDTVTALRIASGSISETGTASDAASGGQQPAFLVHAQFASGSSGGTTSAIDTTGASLIVANVTSAAIGGVTQAAIDAAFSDNKGNVWTSYITAPTPGGDSNILIYCLAPICGTGHTFTCNLSGLFGGFNIGAFSGAVSFDQSVSNGASAQTTLTTGSLTPSHPHALLVAGNSFADTGAATIDTGFTVVDQFLSLPSNYLGGSLAYLSTLGPVPVNATWTTIDGVNQTSILAAFNPTAAGLIKGSTATESGSLSDGVTALVASNASITESGAASDTTSDTDTSINVISETGALSDAVSAIDVYHSVITETLSASDLFDETHSTWVGIVHEALGSVDTVNAVNSTFVGAVLETLAAADTTANFGSTLTSQVLEAPSAVDHVDAVNIALIQAIVETLSASDTVNDADTSLNTISESGSLTDTVNAGNFSLNVITESGTLSDQVDTNVRTIVESASLIDTVSAGGTFVGNIVETGVLVDAFDDFDSIWIVQIQEFGNWNDLSVSNDIYTCAISETMAASDQCDDAGSTWQVAIQEFMRPNDLVGLLDRFIVETLNAADSADAINSTYGVIISELGSLTDASDSDWITLSLISESGTATDATDTPNSIYTGQVSESGTLFDQCDDAGSIYNAIISEGGSAADACDNGGSTFTGTVIDFSMLAQDAVFVPTISHGTFVIELQPLVDTVSLLGTIFGAINVESGTAGDQCDAGGSVYLAQVIETGALVDQFGIGTIGLGIIAEVGTLGDYIVNPFGSIYTGAVIESGDLEDAISNVAGTPAIIVETGTAVDQLGVQPSQYIGQVLEVRSAVDSVNGTANMHVAIREIAALADTAHAGGTTFSVSTTETLSASDQCNGTRVPHAAISETMDASDLVTAKLVFNKSIHEVMHALDAVSTSVTSVIGAAVNEVAHAADVAAPHDSTWAVNITETAHASDFFADYFDAFVAEQGLMADKVFGAVLMPPTTPLYIARPKKEIRILTDG